jgi:GNAT superfamily N-acetyltransferase
MTAIIRELNEADRNDWDKLWAGYLAFYETVLIPEQTALTWSRLLDPDFEMHSLVVEVDGSLVALAHYSFTHSSWSAAQDVYLEDLFVDPSLRGQGLGRVLIESLGELASSMGSSKLWWETHKDNETARRLYDSVGELSEFVKYTRATRPLGH